MQTDFDQFHLMCTLVLLDREENENPELQAACREYLQQRTACVQEPERR